MTEAYEREMAVAVAAAQVAGEAIRDLYDRSAAAAYEKNDGSPVTDADLAADRIIRDALTTAFPADAILTEEGTDDATRLGSSRVWIVDPIDGTQQFIDRTGEFDVLIALCVDGSAVVGVMLQPTTGQYLAASSGSGAWIGTGDARKQFRFSSWEDPIRLSTSIWLNMPAAQEGLSRVAKRLETAEPEVSPLGIIARHFASAERPHDVLIGLPTKPEQTMAWEWDFAAADVVVHEAGGAFTDAWGRRFRYNKPIPRNEAGVVLSVDPEIQERVLAAIRPELP
jgi:3'-phosphoadenosine 5'-phosphosulfate (PAPS) 3'-phosphatase